MPPKDNSQPSSNLPSFAEALAAAQKMQQDWLEHGVNFVDLYVDDVDGDWLEQWGEDEPTENGSDSSGSALAGRSLDHDSFIQLVVKFLMSDDPVAIAARPYWDDRPLPEIAAHLERCLTTPEGERTDAIQALLINGGINSNTRMNNVDKQIGTVELAKSLLKKLLQMNPNTISY